MRCKTCDYSLWNLKARQCPECGSPFKPSEFEFPPGSVRFCCPHCSQHYFGTDAEGHLVPAMFDCVSCGRRIHMDEMLLLPAEGRTEQQTRVDRMPWLERDERGLVKAWFASLKWAMVQPNRLIRAVPADSSLVAAWFYALVTTIVFLSVGVLLPQVAVTLTQTAAGGLRPMSLGISAVTLAVALVCIGVHPLLWALTAHGLLRMTGKEVQPLARTCHAIFYSAGANALSAIPCCCGAPGQVWWVVSATNMLKEAHHVHGGRAALAAIVWPIISFAVAVVGWYAWMMFGLVGGMMGALGPGPMGTPWTPQTMAVMGLSSAVSQYSWQNNGAGPEHAIVLLLGLNSAAWVTGGASATAPFCFSGTNTTPADIPVGSGTLRDYLALSTSAQLGAAQQMLAAQPKNLIAHRFGDFIFTYHGATLTNGDPQLWTVVMLPDPDVNPAAQPNDVIMIGLGAYSATQTTFGQLPGLLQQQNQHRARLGLPPLPDLTTITHANPAVGPPAAPATPAAPESGSGNP